MSQVKEILMFFWITLIPFQDTGLQNLPIGFLGTSPSFIPISMLIIIHFMEWLFLDKKLNVNRIFLFSIGYVLLLSTIYLLISGIESHGRNLIFKTFNLSVLTFLFLYPVFFIDYTKVKHLRTYVIAAFWISIIGVILNDLFPLDFVTDMGLIHGKESVNWRPRGFTGEASYLSVMIVALGFLAAHFSIKTINKLIILSITVFIVVFSFSKGGLLTLFLVAVLLIFTNKTIGKWVRTGILLIIVTGFILLFERVLNQFMGDIESYFSTASRTVLLLTSLLIVIYNPFGVGFSGFLPAIDNYAYKAVKLIDNFFTVPLNFDDVLKYIGAQTDKTLSTKIFLFDYLAYFGIPFLIVFVIFHQKLLSRLLKTDKIFLTAGVLFCLIALSTYIGAIGIYSISLLYGVAFNEVYRKNNSHR